MSSPSVLMRPLEDYLNKSFKDILLLKAEGGPRMVNELKRFLSVGEMQKVLAEVYAPDSELAHGGVSIWSPFSFLSNKKRDKMENQGIWVIILKMRDRPSRFAYPYQLIIGYADANRVVVGPTYAIFPNLADRTLDSLVIQRFSKLPPPFDKAGGLFRSPVLRGIASESPEEQRRFYGIPDNTKLKLLFIPVVHTDKGQVFLNWPKTRMVPLFKLVSTR